MNVEIKRNLKKIAIMETALRVWSMNNFRNTSLSSLSSELNMTKQGLYRYFRNKEDLLTSINDYINRIYREGNGELITILENTPSHERMALFIRLVSDFYSSHIMLVKFDNYWIIKTGEFPIRESFEQMNTICRLLNVEKRAYYLIGMFCQFVFGWEEGKHFDTGRSPAEKRFVILELINHGLGAADFHLPEKNAGVRKREDFILLKKRLLKDNLFIAISSAIQEWGFNDITLEHIASKAGLSKSSLYNYFENKDEMLTETINKLVTEYITFHKELLKSYVSFEEKLLAHIELQEAAMPLKPQSFIVLKQYLNRDALRKINPPADSPDFLSFIQDGIDQKKLKALLSPREYQIIISSFIFIEKVIFNRDGHSDYVPYILKWLKLLAFGIRH